MFEAALRNRLGPAALELLVRYRECNIEIDATRSSVARQWQASGTAAGVCRRDRAHRCWHDGSTYHE